MVGFATQNIDRAACQVIVSGLLGEERPGVGIGDEPSRRVAVKRALEGAQQQIAFGSLVVDDTQPAVTTVVLRPEILTDLGDVGYLTLDNEVLALLNLGHLDLVHSLDGERMADGGFALSPHARDNRPKLFQVLAGG